MSEKKTWNEIVEAYPDRWVALSDYSMDGPNVIDGSVCAVCTDPERFEKEKELVGKKIRFVWRRTTDIEGAYVF